MKNLIFAIIFFLLWILAVKKKPSSDNAEIKEAGNEGERIARQQIKKVLKEDDHLLSGIVIKADGKETELDDLVINKYGVFIIEVKNYSGVLYGDEDDYEWTKEKTTDAGNTYEKEVKNPIKQVKRQVYILAEYLENKGIDVWVEGYAYMVNHNSPVKSKYMLESLNDIDKAIHSVSTNYLSEATIEKIIKML